MPFSDLSCQDSRDNKHEDKGISCVSTLMAKPSYRHMFRYHKYVLVKGFDDQSDDIAGNAISIGSSMAGHRDSTAYHLQTSPELD